MNRVIFGLLLIGVAASAFVSEVNEKEARELLTRYYNVYKELTKDKNFPNSLTRTDLFARLKAADSKILDSVKSQFFQRSDTSPMQALENAFRGMAEEAGFTEDKLKVVAEEMIAEGKFPELREMNKA